MTPLIVVEILGKIRPAAHSELESCAAVIRESFKTVADEFGLTEQNCSGHPSFIKAEKLEKQYNDGCFCFCYFAGGRIAGYVSLCKSKDAVFELNNLAVLPEYRHRGAGRELLDFCAEKVRQLGGKKITLSIIEENTKLENWYEAYGFTHTGTKKFRHLPFTVGFMELDV